METTRTWITDRPEIEAANKQARIEKAAPDLLEALKQLAKEHQELLQEHYGHYPMGCIDYAFMAISKAEGGD